MKQKFYNPNALSPLEATYVNKDRYTSVDRAPDQLVQPIQQTELPHNFFIPRGAKSVNLKTKTTINAGVDRQSIFTFTVPQGYHGMFYGYALSSDSNVAGAILFIPKAAGSNILAFHGDPTVPGNPINLPTSNGGVNDLSDLALVSSQIEVPSGKVIEFLATNTTGAPIDVGVRLIGFVDATKIRHDKGAAS